MKKTVSKVNAKGRIVKVTQIVKTKETRTNWVGFRPSVMKSKKVYSKAERAKGKRLSETCW